jgi:hypothetical protein
MQPLRIGLSILMVLHGVAHLPGFVNSWRLAVFPDLPYHTTLLAGRLEIGDWGMRVVGVLWLAAALGFWVAGAAGLAQRGSWVPLAMIVSAASATLCLLEWPAARIGLWVNLVILLALAAALRLGWLNAPAAT